MKKRIKMSFCKELYAKIVLIKASYNYLDKAYIHLDADEKYYYVEIESKDDNIAITEQDFTSEMLAQCVRHEIYLQTKDIRELIFARAMATSVVIKEENNDYLDDTNDYYNENDILKDWFLKDEEIKA